MPLKDLVGRPRPTPEQRAFEKVMIERIQRLHRGRRGNADGSPVARRRHGGEDRT